MQQVVTRHVINPDLVLDLGHKQVGYAELSTMIDRWKVLLVEHYQARPGNTVVIDFTNPNEYYYSAIFAAFELGLILIADWPNAFDGEDCVQHRMTMHGRINFVITAHGQTVPCDALFNYWNYRRNTANCDHVITDRDFDLYQIYDADRADKIAQAIFVTEDSDLMWGGSGGTTSGSKQYRSNHKKILLQAQRHVRLLEYKKQDRVIHIGSLSDTGALPWYHFLPTWMTCDYHTVGVYADVKDLITTIKNLKINQIQFHALHLIKNFIQSLDQLDHKLQVQSWFLVTKDDIATAISKGIESFKLIFGDSTIGGAFFVKSVDKTTDLNEYERNCLGPQPDDLLQLKIQNGLLYVSIPEVGQDWQTSGDRFELRNGHYYFYGRGNQYTICGETVVLGDLDLEVERLFGTKATIVVDEPEQKIYLSIWQEDLLAEQTLNDFIASHYKNLKIDQTARGLDPARFIASRKIDREKLREYFRHYHLKPVV